jgi:hypothetical protein
MIFIDSPSWPMWLRVLIAAMALSLFVLLAWRYYDHFWRR